MLCAHGASAGEACDTREGVKEGYIRLKTQRRQTGMAVLALMVAVILAPRPEAARDV
jgi:hypothetical protein